MGVPLSDYLTEVKICGDATMVGLHGDQINELRRKDESDIMANHLDSLHPTLVQSVYQIPNENESEIIENHKARLISCFKQSLEELQILEEKRRNLAMRFDFCLTETFSMIDSTMHGYIGLNELNNYSLDSGIILNREDWAVVIDRFDKDKDGYLSFTEFTDIFAPYSHSYRKTMVRRPVLNHKRFANLTVQTKKIIKDLLYNIVRFEINFDSIKYKITQGLYNVSIEIFRMLDENKNGYIQLHEFSDWLKRNGIKACSNNVRIFFQKFHIMNDAFYYSDVTLTDGR